MVGLVLVTGAGGFIGRHVEADLRGQGRETVGWTRAMGDLRNTETVGATLRRLRPDLIVHLAAQGVGSADAPWTMVADEQRMLSNLAYAMPGHCRLVHSGSMAEYGRSGTFAEMDHCTPDTAYGCAKHACTTLALALRSELGLDIRVARLFGVYGAGENSARLLPALIARLLRGETVPLSDGTQVRDFNHVEDVCRVLRELAFADEAPAIVNVGTGVGVSVREVCERVATILSADQGLLDFGAMPRRSVDQDCLVADTRRLATLVAPPVQRWHDADLAAACVAALVEEMGSAAGR